MINKDYLLTSSSDDFMNDEQLSFMRKVLVRMRDSIRLDGESEALLKPLSERHSDDLDQSKQEEDWMIAMKVRALESDLLSDIEKALHKVDSGDYGYCEKSGEPIDIRRLLAFPTSDTTVEEQERQEKIFAIRRRTHAA